VDLKIEFITGLKNDERMSELCRDYGIARRPVTSCRNGSRGSG
jgi:hypothetical protein